MPSVNALLYANDKRNTLQHRMCNTLSINIEVVKFTKKTDGMKSNRVAEAISQSILYQLMHDHKF